MLEVSSRKAQQLLSSVLSVALLSSMHTAEAWSAPAFCKGLDCPKYTVLKTLGDGVELRRYEPGVTCHAAVSVDDHTSTQQCMHVSGKSKGAFGPSTVFCSSEKASERHVPCANHSLQQSPRLPPWRPSTLPPLSPCACTSLTDHLFTAAPQAHGPASRHQHPTRTLQCVAPS